MRISENKSSVSCNLCENGQRKELKKKIGELIDDMCEPVNAAKVNINCSLSMLNSFIARRRLLL